MKSNIEYLKEAIENGTETYEWIEAIEDELRENTNKRISDLISELQDEQTANEELRTELADLANSTELIYYIDTGFGILEYSADTLALQEYMDDLKTKFQGHALQ